MAIASRYGWNYEEFHDMMQQWGYGNSLRQLSPTRLFQLRQDLIKITSNNSDPWELDKQGKRMWFLLRRAGWDRRRLTYYLTKHFKKTHWNALSQRQKRGVMKMLKLYGDKKTKE